MIDRPTSELTVKRENLPARRPTVGLALGGGGARGLAHILVLEVFDELRLRPKVIAGTSIGALFGAAYAAGLNAGQIRALAEETLKSRFDLLRQLFAARSTPIQKVLSVLPLRTAVLNPQTIVDLVFPARMPKGFRGLEIPLRVVATDLAQRRAVVLSEGELKPAIAASIAIPVVFSPVVIDGRTLVDGGLVNPLPYDLIEHDADITVAVDVGGASAPAHFERPPSAIETMITSINILEKSITREKLRHKQPDIYIEVDLDSFHALEFYRPREILAAAEPAKAALRRQLERVLASETLEESVEPEPPARKRQRLLPRRLKLRIKRRRPKDDAGS